MMSADTQWCQCVSPWASLPSSSFIWDSDSALLDRMATPRGHQRSSSPAPAGEKKEKEVGRKRRTKGLVGKEEDLEK